MKLLFVNFSISWGGGEFWHFQHTVELSKRGFIVTMLTNSGSYLSRKLQKTDIPFYSLRITNRSFASPLKHLKIIKIIRKVQPDCIILNGSNELKLAGVTSRLMGVPKVIYRRGNAERVKAHYLNRLLIRSITHLIANSSFVMSQLRRDFSQDLPDSQVIIPNGIHLNSRHIKVDYTSPRIAVLGRLSKEKGVDMAIRAFDIIRKKIPAAKLVIIGEGQEAAKLHTLSDRLGMNGEILFTGFLEHCHETLSGCSLLMIPSRWEGFSFARLEAMSLKLPIVAFELDSLKENLCTVILTFDDGSSSVFNEGFPILERYGIPAVLFPISSLIERTDVIISSNTDPAPLSFLSRAQIRIMADAGWEIGSHLHTHQPVTKLSDAELLSELKESKIILEKISGKPVITLAYPYGIYDERTLKMAASCGYTFGLTTNQTQTGVDPFLELPRIAVKGASLHHRYYFLRKFRKYLH